LAVAALTVRGSLVWARRVTKDSSSGRDPATPVLVQIVHSRYPEYDLEEEVCAFGWEGLVSPWTAAMASRRRIMAAWSTNGAVRVWINQQRR